MTQQNKITLFMEIPEAERTIEIPAENITAAIVKLLAQIQLEFSTISADVLDGCAELVRQSEWEAIEFPEHRFCDMSCPEDNFTLRIEAIAQPAPVAPAKESGYNIAPEVTEYAARFPGLELMATGGGCDYVAQTFSPCRKEGCKCTPPIVLVLTAPEFPGSPATLAEPASVSVYLDERWTNGVELQFESAKVAIEFMAGCTGAIAISEP